MKYLEASSIPVYLTMGNHEFKIDKGRDSDDPYEEDEIMEMEIIWEKFTGLQPYYSRIHKGWKLIFLNSMGGRHLDLKFDENQLNWLQKELQSEEPVLLFFHHPIMTDHFNIWAGLGEIVSKHSEPEFFQILLENSEKIKGIFVGHGHMWVYDKLFNKIEVYETDSFGDNEESPFHIIGIDILNEKIKVSRSPIEFK